MQRCRGMLVLLFPDWVSNCIDGESAAFPPPQPLPVPQIVSGMGITVARCIRDGVLLDELGKLPPPPLPLRHAQI